MIPFVALTIYILTYKCTGIRVKKKRTTAVDSFLPSKMDDDEEPVYRFCFIEVPGVYNFMNKDKSIDSRITTDRPIIVGSTEKTLSLMVDIASGKYSINYTTVQSESIGGIGKDGTMTGCYRSMYENKSDLTMTIIDYPIHDLRRLDPVQIVFEEPAKIISIYHVDPKPSVVYSDILRSSLSSSFTIKTWIIIILAFIVLSVLLWLRGVLFSRNKAINKRMWAARIGKRVKRKDPKPASLSQAVYQTFCHFIQQETKNFDGFLGSFISILMTICFFFIVTLYLNLMSTDLVVITKPQTIDNYEDIMNFDPPVVPAFNRQFDDTEEFEKADGESVRGRFWKKYKDSYIAGDPYHDFEGVSKIVNGSFQGTQVGIMTGLFADGWRRSLCSIKESLLPQQSNAYSWMTQDPTAELHQKGIVVRNGMKKTKFLRGFYLRVRRSFEGGLTEVMRNDLKQAKLGLGMEADPRIVRECLSDVLKTNDFQVENVVLPNFKYLFYMCQVMITLAFAQLFRELQYHTKTAQYFMASITLILDYCFKNKE